ncbi:MAG TPA: type II toxin-antitoxin system RelE/ParE family toxin [Puia sp.]|jgi:proteic killer suppression protein|nr:type II toxin-antitoxin system RelE/ParE family toxin [Puia sp.]
MLVQFKNAYLERIFEARPVAGKPRYSSAVILKFKKTVLKLKYADSLKEIKAQRGLNFEALKGDLKGFYSVRVDYSYRLILALNKDDILTIAEIITIHDLTNHYQ